VPPGDQLLPLEHRERLTERHERHAEVAGEPPLVVEPAPGRE